MDKTYYEVLGVPRSAAAEEIKQAYRRLAKENHPDLHPGDGACEERFKEIGQAWETLGDEAKRKAYDQKLAGGKKKKTSAAAKTAPVGQVDLEEMIKGFGAMFTEDYYQKKADGKVKKGPIDADDMFARFMGYKK